MESHQLLNVFLIRNGTPKQLRRGIRNYAMTLLMLDAGLRVGELCKLLQSDLLFGDTVVQSLVIRAEIAKYKIERTIPLSSRIQMAIAELKNKVWDSSALPNEAFAFYQKTWHIRLTPRQVQRIIKAAAQQSIGRAVHPHILRHTFGTKVWRKAGERITQELLGHKSISSTQIYMHPDADDLKNAIDDIAEDDIT